MTTLLDFANILENMFIKLNDNEKFENMSDEQFDDECGNVFESVAMLYFSRQPVEVLQKACDAYVERTLHTNNTEAKQQ